MNKENTENKKRIGTRLEIIY